MQSNFSIVVPTLRESKNIPELIRRIASLDVKNRLFEVIFVDDDSRDGIIDVVAQLQIKYPWITLIVRHDNKSLSASAIEGFNRCKYPVVILMDADLSHPPEKIIDLLDTLSTSNADFVIGSRYTKNGSTDEKWHISRKFSSFLSRKITQLVLPAAIKDPLSGFFCFKKEILKKGKPLNPIGWKIGLEIMMKCKCQNIQEVPIHFSNRFQGKSKLNLKIILEFFRHIQTLLIYKFNQK